MHEVVRGFWVSHCLCAIIIVVQGYTGVQEWRTNGGMQVYKISLLWPFFV